MRLQVKRGPTTSPIATMLRIHSMHKWFGLADPDMEEALHNVALLREFSQLYAGATRLPDESSVLRFRHLSGTLLQGDQMPVWLSQDSVSGFDQKHGEIDHAVCSELLVDGEKTNYSGRRGVSAHVAVAWAYAQKKALKGQPTCVEYVKWLNQKNKISSGKRLSINSRFCGAYSELT